MKHLLLFLSLAALLSCSNKKSTSKEESSTKPDEQESVSTAEDSLQTRVEEFLKLNDDMNLDAMMEFYYPRIFEKISKEDLTAEIKKTFRNESMELEIDSVKLKTIQPIIKIRNGEYARVDYSMVMVISLNEANTEGSRIEDVKARMISRFGAENVSVEGSKLYVYSVTSMYAVRDRFSDDWTFIASDQGDLSNFFAPDVIEKLEAN